MLVTSGTRLGPSEVTAKIGEGGMSACGHAEPGGEASPLVRGDSRERLRDGQPPNKSGGGGVPADLEPAGAPPPVQKMQTPSPVRSDQWR